MHKERIVVGQRWVSDADPSMGLGVVCKVDFATIEIFFAAVEEVRCYALESAPLRRVVFHKGDRVEVRTGETYEVTAVREEQGLMTYLSEDTEVSESELADTMGFSKPQDRLLGGQVDENRLFQLRAEALYRRCEIQQSPMRGYVGGRTDLLPHQISIVQEVSQRLQPRVLLADEVGLGKTIEACMIMHRLHQTGCANRVLILVPEPLMNQWFVELLRRFNMLFSLFDEARCEAIQAHDADVNPFLDSQLVVASVDFLSKNRERHEQALEAGWDLLIVDEAHHLEWSVEQVSEEYAMVDSFAQCVPRVLLLTATPQQLGMEGHFARLRLLDPERYRDLEVFKEESDQYASVASLVELIEQDRVQQIDTFSTYSELVQRVAREWLQGDGNAKERLIRILLDGFGVGRVMFRNTRENLSGFPERKALLYTVEDKVLWLVSFLQSMVGNKVLLICQSQERVIRLAQQISEQVDLNIAQFHEGLTLNQRDRNAAYFADPEGAQVLLCSEIGSEGRNFQFVSHLVLFDLPCDPELLEQRIGRLDRIGQKDTIHIHVPYAGWKEELWAMWYHHGLGAFEANIHGATEIFEQCVHSLVELEDVRQEKALSVLVSETQRLKNAVGKKLSQGYDKLLEKNTYKPEQADALIHSIRGVDEDRFFEDFLLRMLDGFGVDVEDLEQRNYLLKPARVTTDAFPDIPEDGLSITFDRATALAREELQFMSMDHPVVLSCFELLLNAEVGNAAFGVWETKGEKKLLLECYYVMESMAPRDLQVDRFLPSTPIRVAVDHEGNDWSNDRMLARANLRQGSLQKLLKNSVVKSTLIPNMLEHLERLAEQELEQIRMRAIQEMRGILSEEIERLVELAQRNAQISSEEIQVLKTQLQDIEHAIKVARIRIDSIRLIWKEKGLNGA